MAEIIEHEGDKYIRFGDKLVKIDHFDSEGTPVIGCWSEETKNESGGQDCTVHVPCFQLGAARHDPQ